MKNWYDHITCPLGHELTKKNEPKKDYFVGYCETCNKYICWDKVAEGVTNTPMNASKLQ